MSWILRVILNVIGEYRLATRAGTPDSSYTFYWIERRPKPSGVKQDEKTG